MYEMNEKNGQKSIGKKRMVNTAKECAYVAVFVALLIVIQLAFAVVPGVEFVTVLFVSYTFVFGWKRGMVAATAFSVLRQLIFGFYPVIFILYMVYYNILSVIFGVLGEKLSAKIGRTINKKAVGILCILVTTACVATLCFTMLDNILTPLWYGYSPRARATYFYASLPFMISGVICTAVSVSVLFLPLRFAFSLIKKGLRY